MWEPFSTPTQNRQAATAANVIDPPVIDTVIVSTIEPEQPYRTHGTPVLESGNVRTNRGNARSVTAGKQSVHGRATQRPAFPSRFSPLHGDIFLLDLDSSAFSRVTQTAAEEKDAEFSPNGRFVAFVGANNLYVCGSHAFIGWKSQVPGETRAIL